MQSLSKTAFSGCNALKEICYQGDRSGWLLALGYEEPELSSSDVVVRFQPKVRLLHESGNQEKKIGDFDKYSLDYIDANALNTTWGNYYYFIDTESGKIFGADGRKENDDPERSTSVLRKIWL